MSDLYKRWSKGMVGWKTLAEGGLVETLLNMNQKARRAGSVTGNENDEAQKAEEKRLCERRMMPGLTPLGQ